MYWFVMVSCQSWVRWSADHLAPPLSVPSDGEKAIHPVLASSFCMTSIAMGVPPMAGCDLSFIMDNPWKSLKTNGWYNWGYPHFRQPPVITGMVPPIMAWEEQQDCHTQHGWNSHDRQYLRALRTSQGGSELETSDSVYLDQFFMDVKWFEWVFHEFGIAQLLSLQLDATLTSCSCLLFKSFRWIRPRCCCPKVGIDTFLGPDLGPFEQCFLSLSFGDQ